MSDTRNIEVCWDQLLEAFSRAIDDVLGDLTLEPTVRTRAVAKLETLHAAIRGLGHTWHEIRSLLPQVVDVDTASSDGHRFTPNSAYLKPLARVLHSHGGETTVQEAIAGTLKEMESRLIAADREPLNSGEVRCFNRVRYARLALKERGLIEHTGNNGLWKLTPAGMRWAESDSETLPSPVATEDPRQQSLPF